MADQYYVPKPGLNHVGNYQVSGVPFVSGGLTVPSSSATPIEISFPSVTQRIWVHNQDSTHDLRVGFSSNGVKNNNYYIVDADKTTNSSIPQEFRVKTDKIYLLGANSSNNTTNVSVFAELTGITGYSLAAIYSGSVGIG